MTVKSRYYTGSEHPGADQTEWMRRIMLLITQATSEGSESESELLLVTRSNENHSPGPVMREVSP